MGAGGGLLAGALLEHEFDESREDAYDAGYANGADGMSRLILVVASERLIPCDLTVQEATMEEVTLEVTSRSRSGKFVASPGKYSTFFNFMILVAIHHL